MNIKDVKVDESEIEQKAQHKKIEFKAKPAQVQGTQANKNGPSDHVAQEGTKEDKDKI